MVFEHGAGDIEKTVADGAQCTGMGTAASFQSDILGFALLIAPPRGVRQVVNGIPQSWIAGESSLAAAAPIENGVPADSRAFTVASASAPANSSLISARCVFRSLEGGSLQRAPAAKGSPVSQSAAMAAAFWELGR